MSLRAKSSFLVIAISILLLAMASCEPAPPGGGDGGGDSGDDGTNPTGSSTASPTSGGGTTSPPAATVAPNYDAGAPNFIDDVMNNITGQCNCHAGGSGGYTINQGGNLNTLERVQNYQNTVCCPRMYTYDLVDGRFFNLFCSAPGQARGNPVGPMGTGHPQPFSNAECQMLADWQITGQPGSPSKCFLAQDPQCD